MANNNQEFPKKYFNKLKTIPDFIDGINSMQTEELKNKIIECEKHLIEIEQAVDADEELAKAKYNAKELASSYRESKGIEVAKLKYCLYMLESRGAIA